MEAVAPRQRLANRYVLEDLVATGGMASVWRARDEVLARTVAIKVLREDLATREDFRVRFHHEAIAAARLNHPGIVSIYDTGDDGGVVYIVMELFAGRTMADILAARGSLGPGEAVELILPVLDALAYAHRQGIVHRDVKPANILAGPGGHVKVTDFGIAKVALGRDLTTTGKVLGTVRYLSPEQVEGAAIDGRSDLYSVGVVLYEAVTGRPPFDAETDLGTAMMRLTADPPPARAMKPGIPRDLEVAIMRAMARRPDDRFPSAEAMRAALERRATPTASAPYIEVPAPAPLAGPLPGSTRPSTFRSWLLVPLVLVAIAAIVTVAGLALGRLQFGGPLGIQQASPQPGDARSGPVAISSVEDFDPQGDDQEENGDEAPLAADGDPATEWSTVHYESAAFGELKEGVGLWVGLDEPADVARVTISTPLPGWTFRLVPGAGPAMPDTGALVGEDGSDSFTVDSGEIRIDLRPRRIEGFTIWITSLVPDEGRYAAAVSEVRVEGRT